MEGTRSVRSAVLVVAALIISAIVPAASAAVAPGTWQTLPDAPVARNEASYVQLDGVFHLVAGKKHRHDVYDPATGLWSKAAPLPVRVNMVQAVTFDGKIYVIGGMQRWRTPTIESPEVWIYDPAGDAWTQGAPMTRPRGAGGIAVYKNKIYYAGGISDGHAVRWFDVYIPALDTWRKMKSMPAARDHFQAAVIGSRFYAIGGRKYAPNALMKRVDRFSFASRTWSSKPVSTVPKPIAGYAIARFGARLALFGGEGNGLARKIVQVYNVRTGAWSRFAPMSGPRHGMQAAKCGNGVYIATGSDQQGAHATPIHEVFFKGTPQACTA